MKKIFPYLLFLFAFIFVAYSSHTRNGALRDAKANIIALKPDEVARITLVYDPRFLKVPNASDNYEISVERFFEFREKWNTNERVEGYQQPDKCAFYIEMLDGDIHYLGIGFNYDKGSAFVTAFNKSDSNIFTIADRSDTEYIIGIPDSAYYDVLQDGGKCYSN